MKMLISILCFNASLAVLAADQPLASTNGAPASTGSPSIQFEATSHNFGSIAPQPLKATFKFKNVGDETLAIEKVQPGCGCTVIPDYDKRVEPGKEGVIHADLNASAYRGGHIEKGINVLSNDPKNPNVHLTMMADIKLEFMVLPQQSVSFSGLHSDSIVKQVLEIKSELAEPLVVWKVEPSVPWLTASVVTNAEKSAQIEVSTKPPLPPGMKSGQIIVFTKYDKYKQVIIPTHIIVPPEISVVPERLFFRKSQPENVASASILVSRNDGKEFHITGIHSDTPLITSAITTNAPGKIYKLSVKYTPQDGDPKQNGKLEILTDDPSRPRVEVPVIIQ